MKRYPAFLLALALALPALAHPWADPPADADIDAAIASVTTRVKGLVPPALFEERRRAVADAMQKLPIKNLSLDQMRRLKTAGMLADPASRDPANARLETLADDRSGVGARAAVLRVVLAADDNSILRAPELREASRGALEDALELALAHPGLGEVWKDGDEDALRLFTHLRAVDPAMLSKPDILNNVVGALQPGQNGNVLPGMLTVIDTLTSLDPRPQGDIDRVRTAALGVLETVKAESADEALLSTLIRAQLEGAHAKGTLLDRPAPALTFTQSDASPPVTSLADIKGRVAVLVFWHTGGKASVRALSVAGAVASHYTDSPVTILAVTSPRGNAMDYTDRAKPRKVDTSGKPAEEFQYTRQLMDVRKVPLRLAFLEQVMNGDYGVVRVPTIIIIDPAGNVRARSSGPLENPAMLSSALDAILTEFKLPVPAAPVLAPPAASQPAPPDDDK